MQTSRSSRRDTLRLLMAGGAMLGLGADAHSLILTDYAAMSDQQFLQSLADRGDATVPVRARPYRLTLPIRVAAGRTLRFTPGTVILWDGQPHIGPRTPRGVIIVSGSNVTIGGLGSGVTIRASRPDPDLFGVLVAGQSHATIEEISTIDCSHVFATADDRGGCRDIVVRKGGASFASKPTDPWQGACTIQYTDGFVVEGSRYRNVAHGVQWWGGDAAPTADGAWDRERKCRNGRIERIVVEGAVGCSVWGSMGQGIRVIDCRGTDAGDVGFDAEGSIDVKFLRCDQSGAKRGCFSTFFFNRDIEFRDCRGVQPNHEQPIFRIYSEVMGGNENVAILGGHFECLGNEPATIDDAYGDARSVTIQGATLVNVTIALYHREHSRVVIEDNILTFSGRATVVFDAIRVGVPVTSAGIIPMLRITDNRIVGSRGVPAGSVGIRVLRSPGQMTRSVTVQSNSVTGFVQPLDVP